MIAKVPQFPAILYRKVQKEQRFRGIEDKSFGKRLITLNVYHKL